MAHISAVVLCRTSAPEQQATPVEARASFSRSLLLSLAPSLALFFRFLLDFVPFFRPLRFPAPCSLACFLIPFQLSLCVVTFHQPSHHESKCNHRLCCMRHSFLSCTARRHNNRLHNATSVLAQTPIVTSLSRPLSSSLTH